MQWSQPGEKKLTGGQNWQNKTMSTTQWSPAPVAPQPMPVQHVVRRRQQKVCPRRCLQVDKHVLLKVLVISVRTKHELETSYYKNTRTVTFTVRQFCPIGIHHTVVVQCTHVTNEELLPTFLLSLFLPPDEMVQTACSSTSWSPAHSSCHKPVSQSLDVEMMVKTLSCGENRRLIRVIATVLVVIMIMQMNLADTFMKKKSF